MELSPAILAASPVGVRAGRCCRKLLRRAEQPQPVTKVLFSSLSSQSACAYQ